MPLGVVPLLQCVLVVMKGGRGLKLLDDKLQEVESHDLFHITFWLNTRHPITAFSDGNCTCLGHETHEIPLSDKEKLGLSNKCVYCAQKINMEGNNCNAHRLQTKLGCE